MDSDYTPLAAEPAAVARGESPLAPANLLDLFFRPRRFFSSGHELGETVYVVLVTWLAGISHAIDRVDYNAFRAEMGRPRGIWASLGPTLFSSWGAMWLFLLVLGAISAPFIWLIGGWWFRVRLGWAGAQPPYRREARTVYVYAHLVEALPQVILLVVVTLAFENYAAWGESDELWSSVGLLFPFWSCVAGYAGATARFGASRAKAFVWFVALPWLFYAVGLGIVGLLVTTVGE